MCSPSDWRVAERGRALPDLERDGVLELYALLDVVEEGEVDRHHHVRVRVLEARHLAGAGGACVSLTHRPPYMQPDRISGRGRDSETGTDIKRRRQTDGTTERGRAAERQGEPVGGTLRSLMMSRKRR